MYSTNFAVQAKFQYSTNKGKNQEDVLKQARDYKEDCGEEEKLFNFKRDLRLPIQLDNDVIDRANNKSDRDRDRDRDEVLATVRKNAQSARHKIVDKYSKTYAIAVFA